MKVGIDTFSISSLNLDAFGQLDWIAGHGFDGAQFGCLGTDPVLLRDIRSRADGLGLYSHVSIGSPNPALGAKSARDLEAEMVKQIEAYATDGWHELHSALGADSNRYRHETISWPDQLKASTEALLRLAPVLRHHASRINLETHFDTTTFELARLCETVGPDVCGVCLDTANVMLFGEHPVRAARRVAPFVHLTHTKDAFLFFCTTGLRRQTVPPGSGAIDWEALLSALGEVSPDLPLSIEDHKWLFGAEIFESWWHEQQPDLTREELAMTVQLAWQGHQQILSGERPDPDEYEKIPYAEEMESRLTRGRDYLRGVLKKLDNKNIAEP